MEPLLNQLDSLLTDENTSDFVTGQKYLKSYTNLLLMIRHDLCRRTVTLRSIIGQLSNPGLKRSPPPAV